MRKRKSRTSLNQQIHDPDDASLLVVREATEPLREFVDALDFPCHFTNMP